MPSCSWIPFWIPAVGGGGPPRGAAAVSTQTRNQQHMPCPDSRFHHPPVNYAQLPCLLTPWNMWYVTCGFSFLYRFPYAAHTVRMYVLTLARKIAFVILQGVWREGVMLWGSKPILFRLSSCIWHIKYVTAVLGIQKNPHAISFGTTFLVSKLLLKMDRMDCQ